jgi:hypothetical protein
MAIETVVHDDTEQAGALALAKLHETLRDPEIVAFMKRPGGDIHGDASIFLKQWLWRASPTSVPPHVEGFVGALAELVLLASQGLAPASDWLPSRARAVSAATETQH